MDPVDNRNLLSEPPGACLQIESLEMGGEAIRVGKIAQVLNIHTTNLLLAAPF